MVAAAEGIGTLRVPENCPSDGGMAPNFNYYDKVDIESAQRSFYEQKVVPVNGMADDPYEFHFEPIGETFLHLSSMYMHVEAKIVNAADNTPAAATDVVAPINGLLNTMWSGIETRINNVVLNPSSSFHVGHKDTMEKLLSCEKESQANVVASLFIPDDPGKGDTLTDANIGFKNRRSFCQLGKSFDMAGFINNDFLKVDNFLAPGNRLSLKFTRKSDKYCLLTAETDKEYKLVIENIALYVRRIEVFPDAYAKLINENLMQKYESVFTEVQEFPLVPGIKRWHLPLYQGGVLPKQVVVAMVDTTALTGAFDKNPLRYQPFKLNSINLKVNGVRHPQDKLTPDFTNGTISRVYNHMFMNCGKHRVDSSNSITMDDFKDGMMLLPFDLCPDLCNMYHKHSGKEGTLDLELGWETDLASSITVLVYASFNQVITMSGKEKEPTVSIY